MTDESGLGKAFAAAETAAVSSPLCHQTLLLSAIGRHYETAKMGIRVAEGQGDDGVLGALEKGLFGTEVYPGDGKVYIWGFGPASGWSVIEVTLGPEGQERRSATMATITKLRDHVEVAETLGVTCEELFDEFRCVITDACISLRGTANDAQAKLDKAARIVPDLSKASG